MKTTMKGQELNKNNMYMQLISIKLKFWSYLVNIDVKLYFLIL